MKTRSIALRAMAVLFALVALGARAEDIDVFSDGRDGAQPANLLLVIANAAHSSSNAGAQECRIDGQLTALSGSALGVEQCALHQVVSSLDLARGTLNVGVMMYNGAGMVDFHGNACVGSEGGCLMLRLTRLTPETRSALLAWIKSWKATGSGWGTVKAGGEATAAVMAEAWAYYARRRGISGRDYAGEPHATDCSNYVVFIADALAASTTPGDGGNVSPKAFLEAAPGITLPQQEPITLATGTTPAQTVCGTLASVPTNAAHESGGWYADEWTRYMAANRIRTFTIGLVDPAKCRPDYPWLLASMATHGGGVYMPTTGQIELVNALATIVAEVRAVNSVFASVSLPAAVNSPGSSLNQVFAGMFRPDAAGLPRWFGNLKQYKLGLLSSGELGLLDADNQRAVSGASGFIAGCARSHWTPPATMAGDGYWIASSFQNCQLFPASSNSPDGDVVEKGGQAYMLRATAPAARVVKTCDTTVANCGALTNFDAGNPALTTATFGITPAHGVTRAALIDWARGANNHATAPEVALLNGAPITSADMRPSVHGDVVHSRPAAVNFGTDADPKVVVFYGGNDGMLRAVNGNRSAAFVVAGRVAVAGQEFWSFAAPEFHGKLLRRYGNGASDAISRAQPKDYGVDGPITVLRRPNGDATLYVGLRRGGRTLYAFHVDGATLDITLRWKIGCMAPGNCSAAALGDYSQLGQTWSPPQVVLANGVGGAANPLLMMGGGYDPACEDAAPGCAGAGAGRGLYLIDANTGALVRRFDTAGGVVADVTVVPDADGTAKFIYGADLAGNVVRISGPLVAGQYQPIGASLPGDWVIATVAALGCDSPGCGAVPPRKFMFAPDVLVDGSTHLLLLGSGDREKPATRGNPVANHFFAIKDRPDLGDAYLQDAACGAGGGLCLGSLLGISQGATTPAPDLAASKGWYLRLRPDEQVVTGAIAAFGTVYFSTHQPQPSSLNACVPSLGVARAYGVDYATAAAARSSGDPSISFPEAGLPADLVVGRVMLDDSSTVPFCIGCDGPLKATRLLAPSTDGGVLRVPSFWHIQQ